MKNFLKQWFGTPKVKGGDDTKADVKTTLSLREKLLKLRDEEIASIYEPVDFSGDDVRKRMETLRQIGATETRTYRELTLALNRLSDKKSEVESIKHYLDAVVFFSGKYQNRLLFRRETIDSLTSYHITNVSNYHGCFSDTQIKAIELGIYDGVVEKNSRNLFVLEPPSYVPGLYISREENNFVFMEAHFNDRRYLLLL